MGGQATARDFLTTQAAVILPGLQSLVSGLAIGSTVTSLAILAKAPQPLAIGGVAAGVGLGASWLLGLSWWRARVEGLRADAQAATYASETVRLEVTGDPDSAYPWGMFIDMNLSPALLRWSLEEIANGADLSMSSLTGRGRLSRSEFCELRDGLIRAGLAYWRNDRAHSQGCALNRAGGRVVNRYVDALALQAVNPPPGPQMALKPVNSGV
jgi:hypothetical protein